MEMFMSLGAIVVVALAVWIAAPHHHRLIEKRPKVKGDQIHWD
jgi:hypothetical protein